MTRKPSGEPSPREAGLRRLAAGRHDRIEVSLQQALQQPGAADETQKLIELRALVDGAAASMPAGTTLEQRAQALWRLICGEIELSELLPDERAALRAALHLDPTNREPSIDRRLAFARDKDDFGVQPRPGYDSLRQWWGDGIRKLGRAVDERLDFLHHHRDHWQEYFGRPNDGNEPRYRKPSRGAQPLFLELFTTTVFMRGRFVHRRITERLVTAREDHVEYYTARALPEQTDVTTGVPVRALWGCRAEPVPGEPILTRLFFPTPLQRGQRHWFSSEAMINEAVKAARRAINVEVDHFGIAPGERLHGLIPIRGLTIRVRFEESNLPEACWWYADVTERERYVRPEPDEDRWLAVDAQGCVEHTFVDACQPLANYGVSIAWPAP